MTKTFCDICGKEMKIYCQVLVRGCGSTNRGVPYKIYDCVCSNCKNRIAVFCNNLSNFSEEGETNG